MGWVVILSLGFILNSCVVDPDNDHVDNTRYSASEEFYYRIGTENRSEFSLYGINGSVEITGVSNLAQAEIWGEKIVESDSRSDAETHLELLDVVTDSSDTSILVRTIQPSRSEGRNYIVHYHFRIPRQWKVNANQVNGNIRIISIASAVNTGAASEKGLADSLETRLQTSVVNGSLLLYDLYCSINGQVVNGDITGNMTLPLDGECILQVTNGVINLAIPQNTSAMLSAVTVNGAVQVSGLTLQDAQTSLKSVAGRLGEGRGLIDLNGVNTNIVVSASD